MNVSHDKKARKRKYLAYIELENELARYDKECKEISTHKATKKEAEYYSQMVKENNKLPYLQKELLKHRIFKNCNDIRYLQNFNIDNLNCIKIDLFKKISTEDIFKSIQDFVKLAGSLPYDLYVDCYELNHPILASSMIDVLNIPENTSVNFYYPKEHEDLIKTLFSRWKAEDIKWKNYQNF